MATLESVNTGGRVTFLDKNKYSDGKNIQKKYKIMKYEILNEIMR